MNNKLLQNLESASEKVARIMSATGVGVIFKPGLVVPQADIVNGIVYVPVLPEKLTPDELTKARCVLDHETAHIIFTKDADGNPALLPNGLDGVLQNGIEDGRINRLMGDRFMGSRHNIEGGEAIYFKALREKHDDIYATLPPDEKTNLDRLMALFRVVSRYVERLPESIVSLLPPDPYSDGIPADLQTELETTETADDVSEVTPKVKAWLFTDPETDESGAGDSDDSGDNDDANASDGTDGNNNTDGEPSDDDNKDSDGDGDSDGKDGDDKSDNGKDGDDKSDNDKKGADEPDDNDNKDDSDGDGKSGQEDSEKSPETGPESSQDGQTDNEAENDKKKDATGDTNDSDDVSDDDTESKADVMVVPKLEGEKTESKAPEISEKDRVLFERFAKALDAFRDEVMQIDPTDDSVQALNTDFPVIPYMVDTTGDTEIHITKVAAFAGRQDRIERYAEKGKALFSGINDKVAALRGRLILDLQATGKAWQSDLENGRRLNMRALHRPSVGDGRVFKNRIKKRVLNTAVTLLVDNSGSMASSGKYERAIQLAAVFCDALEMAGVPCEVLGFTTHRKYRIKTYGIRHDNLLNIVYKDFTERATTNRSRWYEGRTVLGNNMDGESILWAARRLVVRPESRKILLVLSDGFPAGDIDPIGGSKYFTDGYTLDDHLKESVELVEKSGVEVVGVGIKSGAPRRYYPQYVRYENLDELFTGFYRAISNLLRTGKLDFNAA